MVRELKADADIVRDQDRPSQCCAILEGFACRYKLLPGGRRQIMSFHIPGDIPDLQSLHLEVMDHSLATVVPSKVAFIPHEAVRTFLGAHPRIADVFWRDTLIDAAVFREWVVNGLITTPKGGRVVILDWPGLQTAGEFDATYLHLKQAA